MPLRSRKSVLLLNAWPLNRKPLFIAPRKHLTNYWKSSFEVSKDPHNKLSLASRHSYSTSLTCTDGINGRNVERKVGKPFFWGASRFRSRSLSSGDDPLSLRIQRPRRYDPLMGLLMRSLLEQIRQRRIGTTEHCSNSRNQCKLTPCHPSRQSFGADPGKIHLKRGSSQRDSLCGRFPVHAFRTIIDLASLPEQQRRLICRTCLKAAEIDIAPA